MCSIFGEECRCTICIVFAARPCRKDVVQRHNWAERLTRDVEAGSRRGLCQKFYQLFLRKKDTGQPLTGSTNKCTATIGQSITSVMRSPLPWSRTTHPKLWNCARIFCFGLLKMPSHCPSSSVSSHPWAQTIRSVRAKSLHSQIPFTC